MKLSTLGAAVLTAAACIETTTGFRPHALITSQPTSTSSFDRLGRLHADETEDLERLRPETSFGAEAVPEAQRPVNEYLDVTQQPLFGWASEDTGSKGFFFRLVITYAIVFGVVCYPISGATFTQEGYELQKLAAANVGALSLLLLLMLRLYSGWGYLAGRLTSKVIEYEVTGWFDGDFEPKTEAELRRDRFLYKDKVKPVVNRLRTFSYSIGGLCLASIVGLNVALSAKPMFDHYDPHMLERLSYDDKLANKAASTTGGQPAYCDSRYYRAIANGGQGCK